jgi:ubiquinone/menaquinone biosynthesis C-methylase UbiE
MQAQQSTNVGFLQPIIELDDWQEAIRDSWYLYLVNTLGLSTLAASERAEQEINRSLAKETCDALAQQGFNFQGAKVLDLGCGHGTLAIEIASRGGEVVGIEPCQQWREIATLRAQALLPDPKITFIDGDATQLPFEDESFDYVLSLQVLEHVKQPYEVAPEIKRILRRDGKALISCENYLAFREQHYKIFWLPLLPKFIGATYLRMRRRDPQFLLESITYTTSLRLIHNFLKHGLWSQAWGKKYSKNFWLQYFTILLKQHHNLFRVGFYHIFEHTTIYTSND